MNIKFINIFIIVVVLVFASTNTSYGQKNNDTLIFGKYIQNVSDSLLFKSVYIFRSDSTFTYLSIGKFKDSITGNFNMVNGTIFLKYSDGYNENTYPVGKPTPIEMLGIKVVRSNRRFKLFWANLNICEPMPDNKYYNPKSDCHMFLVY